MCVSRVLSPRDERAIQAASLFFVAAVPSANALDLETIIIHF